MPLQIFRIAVGPRRCVQGHTVSIYDRGGRSRLLELKDMSEVKWNRVTDSRSQASVSITGAACRRQARALGNLEPRRHELVIHRGEDRVWEGPIRFIKQGRNSVNLQAYDVLDYVAARPMTKWWPGPEFGGATNMTERVQQILAYEMATNYTAPGTSDVIPAWENVSPKINLLEYLDIRASTTLKTSADVLPFEMTVMEHLQNLAKGGLNFTMVGRRLVVWDSASSLGRTRTLTEADLQGDPTIFADGDKLTTVQHVITTPEENTPESSTENVGSYVRDMSYYGPWASIHTRSEEIGESANVQVALSTQARSLSAGKVPVPVELQVGSTSSLRLDGSLGINDLVAGIDVPVIARLMGREMRQTQQLVSLEVSETGSGESIQANIAPSSTEN